MLRIFRGERRAGSAAQPAQREQGPSLEVEADRAEAAPSPPATTAVTDRAEPAEPGFLDRSRMRRRARFLHVARELAYRDLGGLVFDLHRFGQRNDEIVKAKLDTLGRIDSELRALEQALRERKPVSVLREAGVAACPRCAAIHGSGDRYCPACGLAVDQAERPVAGPSAPAPTQASLPPAPAPTRASAPPPTPEPMSTQALSPPPAPVPAATQAPSLAPAPAPTQDPALPPVPAPTAAPPAAPAAPASEQTPAAKPEADAPTEVIAAGRRGERTVAFDPLSPLQAAPPEEAGGQERKRS